MGTFSAGLAGYAKRAKVSIDTAVTEVCAQTAINVIKKTPRDIGRAQGNWFAEINSISTAESETRTENEAIADATMKSTKASGNIFTLTNNLDYIATLEYGLYPNPVKYGTRLKNMSAKTKKSGVRYEVRSINGFSTQAPQGMLRISIAETVNKLKGFT